MKQVNINIDRRVFNDVYFPILKNESRYLIIYGGAGSGKSVFIAQKHVLRCLSEKKHRFLIIRETFKSHRESTFKEIIEVLERWKIKHLFTINKTSLSIKCTLTNSEIIFAGLDDVEKLKSISGITGIWIEEASETFEEDFNQLDLRLRGITQYYKQIIISFNPILKTHWLKSRFFDATADADITVLKTTYLDNKYIGEQYKKVFEILKVKDRRYYEIYCLGSWGSIKEGLLFKQDFYTEYDELPEDCKGVIYADTQLSKDGSSTSDFTAIVKLLYSPSKSKYYVQSIVKRFSNSNELLDAVMSLKDETVRAVGFDGHYTQQIVWTNLIRSYCQTHSIPFQQPLYCRYNVDELAKNLQYSYVERNILFPQNFRDTDEGAEFCSQFFSFTSKKENKKDDAADALICAYQLIHERNIATNINYADLMKQVLKR